MRSFSLVIAALFMIAAVPCVAATLNGQPAVDAILDHSLTGWLEAKGDISMIFAKDGTLLSKENGSTVKGNWSFDGAQLCLASSPTSKDCFILTVSSGQAYFKADGSPDVIKLSIN